MCPLPGGAYSVARSADHVPLTRWCEPRGADRVARAGSGWRVPGYLAARPWVPGAHVPGWRMPGGVSRGAPLFGWLVAGSTYALHTLFLQN